MVMADKYPEKEDARARQAYRDTLSSILNADQDDAATASLARKVALYYTTLVDAGMSAESAEQGAAEYQSLLLAQAFMDVHQSLSAGFMFGAAD